MHKEKSILVVFPDEWLQYSPSVLNLYQCCSEKYYTKLVYVDNGKFKNEGLVAHYRNIKIGRFAAYFWRKTFGYKFYKVLRLFFTLLFIKLFNKRYDIVIGIDSSGYAITKLFFQHAIYFSLETEKDNYFKLSELLGIEKLLIQSKERKDFLIGDTNEVEVFYIQNAPIITKPTVLKEKKEKRILYMGNIEYGYGLEQFIDCVSQLDTTYTLTLKGIKNDRFFNFLNEQYKELIANNKLIFDFSYVDQSKIIEYAASYYIGITGYDIELAKKSFNYFSSPAGKLFNYYAAGIPVIGIDIIGLKSVTDFNAGVLIDEVNPDKIKQAILAIEQQYTTYAENCLVAANTFDFKTSFTTFYNAITSQDHQNQKPLIHHIKNFKVKTYLTQGHERSIKAKKNILASVLIKCVSIVISFLLIPMALNYLSPVKYGIWITLTSVIGWFTFFDLGLGNGLRNKLAEAFSKNDRVLARTYISTSYVLITAIIGFIYTIFFIIHPYLNWGQILNTPPEMNEEISKLVLIIFSFFSLQFIVKLIVMILKADQLSSISAGVNTFASLLSLIIIYVLTKTIDSSLLWLSVGISAANLIAPLIITLWFFYKNYNDLIPSLKFVKLKYAKDLMGLGFLFFVMQFAALIVFSTDSIIIAQLYGPEAVTPYNIAFKYFSIVTMVFGIITTPFWSAYTDAYHKNDFEWIRHITKKLSTFWVYCVVLVIAMIVCCNVIYKIWIGTEVKIPFLLSVSMGVWVLISSWTSIFGNFLSGVGKIRLSLYHSVIVIFINIPISIFLAKYLQLGSTGVIIGTCLCMFPQVFLHPIQYKKIITNTAKGIWAK